MEPRAIAADGTAIGFRGFLALWLGQTVSLVGSRMSRLALGVWLYQQTGAVTDYALVMLCDALPMLLLTPFTGLVADLYDRRRIMLLADTGAALSTLLVAWLIVSGNFQPWLLYVAVVASSSAGTLQAPAWSAAMTQLVPREHLARAVGLAQAGEGTAEILAPLLAGWVLATVGITGALLFDFATFLVGVGVLLGFRFPPVPRPDERLAPRGSVWRELLQGGAYVLAQPGMRGLVALTAFVSLAIGSLEVLVPPLLLALASPAMMGLVLSTGGVGALCGSVAMSVWGGPRRKMDGLLAAGAVLGLSLAVAGSRASVPLLAVTGWVAMFCVPLVWSCNHAIWQLKVPAHLQGRAFGIRRVVSVAGAVLAFFCAGPLADRVFEPGMAPGGVLAGSVGFLVGVGKGRGIALLLMMVGLLLVSVMLVGRASRRFYRVEDEPEPVPSPQ
ncbi:MAG: MFS transporter [Myxococcaceae bacterium]|nr:MFS transporter [Myxococcaceae bacterium]